MSHFATQAKLLNIGYVLLRASFESAKWHGAKRKHIFTTLEM